MCKINYDDDDDDAGAVSFPRSYQSSHRIWSECAAPVLICPGFVSTQYARISAIQ